MRARDVTIDIRMHITHIRVLSYNNYAIDIDTAAAAVSTYDIKLNKSISISIFFSSPLDFQSKRRSAAAFFGGAN